MALLFFPDLGKRLKTKWLIPNRPITYLVTSHGTCGSYSNDSGSVRLHVAHAVIFCRMSTSTLELRSCRSLQGASTKKNSVKLTVGISLRISSQILAGLRIWASYWVFSVLTERVVCCCRQPGFFEEELPSHRGSHFGRSVSQKNNSKLTAFSSWLSEA